METAYRSNQTICKIMEHRFLNKYTHLSLVVDCSLPSGSSACLPVQFFLDYPLQNSDSVPFRRSHFIPNGCLLLLLLLFHFNSKRGLVFSYFITATCSRARLRYWMVVLLVLHPLLRPHLLHLVQQPLLPYLPSKLTMRPYHVPIPILLHIHCMSSSAKQKRARNTYIQREAQEQSNATVRWHSGYIN